MYATQDSDLHFFVALIFVALNFPEVLTQDRQAVGELSAQSRWRSDAASSPRSQDLRGLASRPWR
jgi:hypothetical protein